MRRWFLDGLVAGAVAWVPSEIPSAVHAVATGHPPLRTDIAAGNLFLPADAPPRRLLALGLGLRILVCLNWGVVMARWLDRRHWLLHGAQAGLAIGLFEYRLGQRRPLVRDLPALPQLADLTVFGIVVGLVLRRRVGSVPA